MGASDGDEGNQDDAEHSSLTKNKVFVFVFDLKVETSSALSSFLLSYLKEELAREVCI